MEKSYQNVRLEKALYKQVRLLAVIKGLPLQETMGFLVKRGLDGESLEVDFIAQKK